MNLPAPYEVHNPSFGDMTLEEQIAVGINDWCAEGPDGHKFFGRDREEAVMIRICHGNYN